MIEDAQAGFGSGFSDCMVERGGEEHQEHAKEEQSGSYDLRLVMGPLRLTG